MLKYDKDSKTLKIQKIEPKKIDIDLLADQKESYLKYMKDTIHEDVNTLCQDIMDATNVKNLTATVRVKDLYSTRPKKEIKNKGNQYYPVEVTFYRDGFARPPVTLLKIPYMDDFCVLNVDGSEKILISELKSAEDISYNENKKALSIVLPHSIITIGTNPNSIKFKLGKSFVDADKVMMGFIIEDKIDLKLEEYFRNSFILSTLTNLEFKTEDVLEDEIAKTGILRNYRSEKYSLGRLRDSLNKKLTIDKCVGYNLSRDMVMSRTGETYKEGSIITKAMLTKFKYNLINEVYIKAVPRVEGRYLTEPINITTLKRSSTVNDFIKKEVPRYSRFSYLPEDINVDINLNVGTPITSDILQVLFDSGVTKLECSSNKTLKNSKSIYFEQEIIGNYTAQLYDFLDEVPEGLSSDDYTYYYGVEDPYSIKEITRPEHLTTHDILALVSMAARVSSMPELGEVYDRDLNFLKKVNMINETFSESLRAVSPNFIKKFKNLIEEFLVNSNSTREPFFGLNSVWIKNMMDKKLLRTTEGVNPISLLTQANRIASVTASSNSVAKEMRALAMGFYGRICPYETTAGKNIGLMNTIAYGCKVVDGNLLTPYHKVTQRRKGYVVLESVVYLTAAEEMNYRIGDLLSIKMDKNRNLIDTKVTARVPNPESIGEKTTVATISSHALDYVNALPEQHLSPTAMLIPFASGDDAARVSFGLGLIRQSVGVQHSEVPLVTTSMYKTIFDYSDDYIVKAKASGTVVAIESDTLILQYDNSDVEEVLYVTETKVTKDAITIMNYKVREGDRFKKGDILVDSQIASDGYFSPGVNVLTAYIPYDGYNYEDAVVMSEHTSRKFTSITGNEVTKKIKPREAESINLGRGNYFRYVPKGGTVATIDRIRSNDQRRDVAEPMISEKEAGILFDIKGETDEVGDKIYTAQLIELDPAEPADKFSGRHGNKGVTSIIEKNSNMPVFRNGKVIEVVLNPCGVVSRMNIGQQLEAHCGFIAYLLGIRIESDPFNGATIEEIKSLMSFVYELANNPDPQVAISMHPGYPDTLYKRAIERHEDIREWEGSFFKDGSAELYNPQTGKMFEYPITFGMPYLLKINQEVDHKMHSRGGIVESEYSMLENQPTQGSARGGGQKTGEMELHALAAHGAAATIRETTNEKSDNVGGRVNLLMDMQGKERIYKESELAPRSTEIIRYMLELTGIFMEIDELPKVDYETVKSKTRFDEKSLARKIEEGSNVSKREQKMKSTIDSLNSL